MTTGALNPALALAGLAAVFAACLLGATPISPGEAAAALFRQGPAETVVVLWEIRLPRALAAFVVGAALGLSGAALQGLLRNPLAEPGVLGVSAASSLGAVIAIYYGLVSISAWALPVAAILGALAATALLAFTALRTRSVATLILVGVGLSSFAGAAMSLLLNFAPNPFFLADMVSWMLGSVANRSLEDLGLAAPFLIAGAALLWASRRGLSALALGEEAAAGVGLDLARQRLAVVAGAGLATGAAVSIAGAVGFVGIVAPHLIRPWAGYDPARTLLPSALLGGVLVTLADIAVRVAPTTQELKLGVVAALVGAPVFVWIALQRGRSG